MSEAGLDEEEQILFGKDGLSFPSAPTPFNSSSDFNQALASLASQEQQNQNQDPKYANYAEQLHQRFADIKSSPSSEMWNKNRPSFNKKGPELEWITSKSLTIYTREKIFEIRDALGNEVTPPSDLPVWKDFEMGWSPAFSSQAGPSKIYPSFSSERYSRDSSNGTNRGGGIPRQPSRDLRSTRGDGNWRDPTRSDSFGSTDGRNNREFQQFRPEKPDGSNNPRFGAEGARTGRFEPSRRPSRGFGEDADAGDGRFPSNGTQPPGLRRPPGIPPSTSGRFPNDREGFGNSSYNDRDRDRRFRREQRERERDAETFSNLPASTTDMFGSSIQKRPSTTTADISSAPLGNINFIDSLFATNTEKPIADNFSWSDIVSYSSEDKIPLEEEDEVQAPSKGFRRWFGASSEEGQEEKEQRPSPAQPSRELNPSQMEMLSMIMNQRSSSGSDEVKQETRIEVVEKPAQPQLIRPEIVPEKPEAQPQLIRPEIAPEKPEARSQLIRPEVVPEKPEIRSQLIRPEVLPEKPASSAMEIPKKSEDVANLATSPIGKSGETPRSRKGSILSLLHEQTPIRQEGPKAISVEDLFSSFKLGGAQPSLPTLPTAQFMTEDHLLSRQSGPQPSASGDEPESAQFITSLLSQKPNQFDLNQFFSNAQASGPQQDLESPRASSAPFSFDQFSNGRIMQHEPHQTHQTQYGQPISFNGHNRMHPQSMPHPHQGHQQNYPPQLHGQQGFMHNPQGDYGAPQYGDQNQGHPGLEKWFGNTIFQNAAPLPSVPQNVRMLSLEEIERQNLGYK